MLNGREDFIHNIAMGERDQAQLQTQQDKGGFTANERSEGGSVDGKIPKGNIEGRGSLTKLLSQLSEILAENRPE